MLTNYSKSYSSTTTRKSSNPKFCNTYWMGQISLQDAKEINIPYLSGEDDLSLHYIYPQQSLKFFKMAELYARYAAIENVQTKPIYSYADYKKAKISYHTFFLIGSPSDTLHAVFLFDNYETASPKQHRLRFAYRYPTAKTLKIQKHHLDQIERILGNIFFYDNQQRQHLHSDDDTAISNINKQNYLRPFTNSPIITDHEKLYRSIFNKRARNSINDYIVGSRYNSKYIIKIPYLNPQQWQNQPSFQMLQTQSGTSILGANYHCILVSGKLPQFAQKIAYLYAAYLRNLEGYDCVPSIDTNETVFILDPSFRICFGVLIFKFKNIANVFTDTQACYEQYVKDKNITDKQALLTHISDKREKVAAKIETRENEINEGKPVDETNFLGFMYKRRLDPTITKLGKKDSLLHKISFFAHAKQQLPKNPAQTASLRIAWIHPFHQRKGILSKLWPTLKQRYGCIDVDSPSKAMQKFLENHSTAQLALESNSERSVLSVCK